MSIYIGEVVDGSRMWCELQEKLTEVKENIRSKTFSTRSNLREASGSHSRLRKMQPSWNVNEHTRNRSFLPHPSQIVSRLPKHIRCSPSRKNTSANFTGRRMRNAFLGEVSRNNFHQVTAMTSASATIRDPRDATSPELVVNLGVEDRDS